MFVSPHQLPRIGCLVSRSRPVIRAAFVFVTPGAGNTKRLHPTVPRRLPDRSFTYTKTTPLQGWTTFAHAIENTPGEIAKEQPIVEGEGSFLKALERGVVREEATAHESTSIWERHGPIDYRGHH